MRKQVLARNGKLYYLDHPKPIISPYVMMPDQIRTHLRELTTNPSYGWAVPGGRAGLERALGMRPRTLRSKLTVGWIWPGEQRRLTGRIRAILDGYIVPRRVSPRTIEGIYVDPPEPPAVTPAPRTIVMHATLAGPSSPVRLSTCPPPAPPPLLPSFKTAFTNAPYWDPWKRRDRRP